MVIKPRGLEVVVWGAISAVGNIRDEIVVFAVIAPTPPPAIRRENDGMKSVPGYCTWPAIPRMVGVLASDEIRVSIAPRHRTGIDTLCA